MTVTSMKHFHVRLNALRHKLYIRGFSGIAPYYLVNEFPKCGGTWLCQMLAAAMEIEFRRNEPIRYESAVTHGHFLNPAGLKNVVVLWRDPRDMLVSFYFHCFFMQQHGNELMVKLMRERAMFDDFYDVRANMPDFIRLISKNPLSPRFSWPQFAKMWLERPGTQQVRYEDLRRNASSELQRIVKGLNGQELSVGRAAAAADAFTFERAKAKAEAEHSASGEGGVAFVREGSVGGWRKYFSPQANGILEAEGYREPMLLLGYPDLG